MCLGLYSEAKNKQWVVNQWIKIKADTSFMTNTVHLVWDEIIPNLTMHA